MRELLFFKAVKACAFLCCVSVLAVMADAAFGADAERVALGLLLLDYSVRVVGKTREY